MRLSLFKCGCVLVFWGKFFTGFFFGSVNGGFPSVNLKWFVLRENKKTTLQKPLRLILNSEFFFLQSIWMLFFLIFSASANSLFWPFSSFCSLFSFSWLFWFCFFFAHKLDVSKPTPVLIELAPSAKKHQARHNHEEVSIQWPALNPHSVRLAAWNLSRRHSRSRHPSPCWLHFAPGYNFKRPALCLHLRVLALHPPNHMLWPLRPTSPLPVPLPGTLVSYFCLSLNQHLPPSKYGRDFGLLLPPRDTLQSRLPAHTFLPAPRSQGHKHPLRSLPPSSHIPLPLCLQRWTPTSPAAVSPDLPSQAPVLGAAAKSLFFSGIDYLHSQDCIADPNLSAEGWLAAYGAHVIPNFAQAHCTALVDPHVTSRFHEEVVTPLSTRHDTEAVFQFFP